MKTNNELLQEILTELKQADSKLDELSKKVNEVHRLSKILFELMSFKNK